MKSCSNCGAVCPEDAVFCPDCGASLTLQTAAPASTAPSATPAAPAQPVAPPAPAAAPTQPVTPPAQPNPAPSPYAQPPVQPNPAPSPYTQPPVQPNPAPSPYAQPPVQPHNAPYGQAPAPGYPGYPYPQQQPKRNAPLVLGIVGIVFAILLPLVTYCCSIPGLVMASKDIQRGLPSQSARVLNIIALALAVVNSVLGITLRLI